MQVSWEFRAFCLQALARVEFRVLGVGVWHFGFGFWGWSTLEFESLETVCVCARVCVCGHKSQALLVHGFQ